MADGADGYEIRSVAQLEAIFGTPAQLAVDKQLDHLDKHCRHIISLSPFVAFGSAGADGLGDVTPRGDKPGFVQVLDDRTLAIPDRPGNNRLDTFRNIVENPGVGLLFFVPGVSETLRINGLARLTTDPALLETMAVDGKQPKVAVVIEVKEAYLHCGKALKRSKLWEPESRVPAGTVPTLGRIIVDQTRPAETVDQIDARIDVAYRERLY